MSLYSNSTSEASGTELLQLVKLRVADNLRIG